MIFKRFFIALMLLVWPAAVMAAEQIDDFTVEIDVLRSGDINVTETISVTSAGNQIRRGIYRDLPRYYESNGANPSKTRSGILRPMTNSTGTSPAITGVCRSMRRGRSFICPKARA